IRLQPDVPAFRIQIAIGAIVGPDADHDRPPLLDRFKDIGRRQLSAGHDACKCESGNRKTTSDHANPPQEGLTPFKLFPMYHPSEAEKVLPFNTFLRRQASRSSFVSVLPILSASEGPRNAERGGSRSFAGAQDTEGQLCVPALLYSQR